MKELAGEPFILLDLPYSHDYFFGLFRSIGVEPHIVFRSCSQGAIRGLVAHGYGLAVQNAIPATTIISDGNRIAVLALDDELPPTTTVSLRLKRYTARPAVRTFEAYMHEAFAPSSITVPRVDP